MASAANVVVVQDALSAMEMAGSWSRLPDEISEHVLSFLAVPALYRCRSVCKKWNELTHKPSFPDLCDQNGGSKPYLLVTDNLTDTDGWRWVDDAYVRRTFFLDLDEGRWYSIPAPASLLDPTLQNTTRLLATRLLAMDDGLVCQLCALHEGYDEGTSKYTFEGNYELLVFDPIARTSRKLPFSFRNGKPVFRSTGDDLPVIVTVVDKADRSFKVFLMNPNFIFMTRRRGFFVYESSTNAWRGLSNPPRELWAEDGDFGHACRVMETAVFCRGKLYATFWYNSSTVLVLSYNLEENSWRPELKVKTRNPGCPQLVVSGDSMFFALWVDPPRPTPHPPSAPPSNYSRLEIRELLVAENSRRSLVRMPRDNLQEFTGKSQNSDNTTVIPLNAGSLLLLSRPTGRLMILNHSSGAVAVMPAHPLRPTQQTVLELEEREISVYFSAKLVNLSLRNILSEDPATARSHA